MIKRAKQKERPTTDHDDIEIGTTNSGKTFSIDGDDSNVVYLFSYSYDGGFGRTKICIDRKIDRFEDVVAIEDFIEKESEITNVVTITYTIISDNEQPVEPNIY